MSQPEYWKDLAWIKGWSRKPKIVLFQSFSMGDPSSAKVMNMNDDEHVEPVSSQEMSLTQSLDRKGDYNTTFLKHDSKLFARISKYLQVNASARSLAPPTGERTRMVRAQKAIDDAISNRANAEDFKNPDSTSPATKALKTNLRTLLENFKFIDERFARLYVIYKIPRVKTVPPKSGHVVITNIRVIKHDKLWEKYHAARVRIKTDIEKSTQLTDRVNSALASVDVPYAQTPARALTTGGKVYGRNPVTFTTQSDEGLTDSSTAHLPILDAEIGEVLLMHGTLPNVIKIIADKGFDPTFSKGTTSGGVTKYGALGQGTYFGDSFAKVQTYTGCPICNALKCDCKYANDDPVDRMLILARCLLGVPTKARTHDSHRKESASTIKPGKHSVIGQERGISKSWTLFGSNEFLLKQADQMYPEFIIYWRRM